MQCNYCGTNCDLEPMALESRLKHYALLCSFFVLLPAWALSQCEVDAGEDIWICAGESVTIGGSPTLVETPDGDNWSWGWNNGIGEEENPEVSPSSTTTYTVNINTPGPGFCDTDEVTVFVYDNPSADFDFTPDDVCATVPIQFTNNSTGDGLTYDWDFGDGGTSTQSNPSHTFDAIGDGQSTFTVTLTVTDENGCTDTHTEEVTINEVPDPIIVDPTFSFVSCSGENEFTVSVLDQSIPADNANYTIDWGDGSPVWDSSDAPNPFTASHTYTGLNIWTLTYTVLGNNGCSNSTEQLVANITNPAIGASTNGNTTVCGPVEICFNLANFLANHESTTYTVNFGDGSAPTVYNHPPPEEVCHEYSSSSCTAGNPYTFEVEANNVCTFSQATISPITIYTPPSASFHATPVPQCVNVPVTMVNTSTLGYYTDCSQTGSFFWDFGDGTTTFSTTNDNQSHTYNAPGTYTVTLSASNACNVDAPSIYTQEVCIEEPPSPSFTTSPDGCVPFTISPVNTSSIGEVCALEYTWTMGTIDINCAASPSYEFVGGTTLNDENPEIQINAAGTYELVMSMQNACGVYTYTDVVQAFDVPQLSMTSLPTICAGESASPSVSVEPCNSPVTSYEWNLEGGSPATSMSSTPGSVTWGVGGNYNVTVDVTNACGTSMASTPIVVQDAPVVSVSASTGTAVCSGSSTVLTASGASTYTWSFDPDLSTTSGPTTTALPNASNTYTVTGYTSSGCPGTQTITVDVLPLPEVTPSGVFEICAGETVELGLNLSGGTPPFVDYNWSPGGTLDDTGVANPDASPLTTTNYDVAVTDDNGCVGWGSVPVTVNPLPFVDAGDPVQLCNQPVAETLTGYSPTTGGTWSGPGVTPDGDFTPSGLGPVTLTYTFTDANGCTSSDDLDVDVIDPVAADAGADVTLCADGMPVALTPITPGGTWAGTGVASDGTFTPTTSGTFDVTYTIGAGSCLSTDNIDIEVFALPQVDAGPDATLCAGDSVLLGGAAVGGQLPYTTIAWTPTSGVTSSDELSTYLTPPATSPYTLSVTDSNGCTGTDVTDITVQPTPVVDAGLDLTLCNQPIPEALTGYGPLPGAGETATWTGDGVTPDGTFTPAATGTVWLTYSFTNTFGCTGQDSLQIDVVEPVAVDGGPDLELCLGTPSVQLTQPGTWTGTGVAPDGTFDPAATGSYDLTLTVGVGTCATTDAITVEVLALPTVDAGPDGAMCADGQVQLDATASSPNGTIDAYVWVGDASLSDPGVEDPSVAPAVTSEFTLTVTDAAGCQASDNTTVTVSPLPVVEAGPNLTVCNQPIPEVLTGYGPLPGLGESAAWSGEGVTADGTFTPDATGAVWLTYSYTDTFGCTGQDSLQIDVVEPVAADGGPDLELCLGTPSVQLIQPGTWTGTGVTPDGTFDPAATGFYDLILTVGVGTCATTDAITVEVLALPTVDAGPDGAMCADGQVQLDATVSSPNGTIDAYVWVGDASLSDPGVEDPSVAPAVTSEFTLTVTDAAGCQASDNTTVTVSPLPVVEAGPNLTVCDQPIAEVLEGFSPVPGATEDGTWTGTGITDPLGVFESPGEGQYWLFYTFTDAGGCIDTDSLLVDVVAPVVANAGPDETICLNNGLLDLTGYTPATGATWSGPGVVDAATGVFDATATGDGTFTLTLEYGSGTCYTTDQLDVVVQPLPVVLADPLVDLCANEQSVDLTGNSPLGGTWEGTGITDGTAGTFDPGIGASTYDLIYIYADPTTGCADTALVAQTVHPVPVADFDLAPLGCTDANVDLTNTSTGATAYEWDLGNAVVSFETSPLYTYQDEGFFDIQLVAINAFGCQDTTLQTNEIIDPPSPDLALSPSEGCAPLEVTFINNSVGQYLTYSWDLAVNTSVLETPDPITYQQGDDVVIYPISLAATNFCGTVVDEDQVTVYPQPVANFGTDLDVFCSPFTVEINDLSTGLPDTWWWDFDDGTFSGSEEPGSHVFFADTVAVDYTISLVVTNDCGTDSADYTITVLPNTVTAFFNTNITEGCEPLEVEFTDFSEGGTAISYDFGDTFLSGEASPTHTFTEPGTYLVQQFVTNGCSFDTTEVIVTVFESADLSFETDVPNVCGNQPVQFINTSDGVSSVSWDFGDGGSSDLTNPFHTYQEGGTYTVTLSGATLFTECPAEVQETFTVYETPIADFDVGETVGCSPFTVQFDNLTDGGLFYTWDFGDTNVDDATSPEHTYINPTGSAMSVTVQLVAQNFDLCADTATLNLIVSPTPVADFDLSATESCTYPFAVQTFNNSIYGNSYDWDFGPYGTSDLTNPNIVYTEEGTFPVTLTVSNTFGCTDQTGSEVSIYPTPDAWFGAPVNDGCVPLEVAFINESEGATEYQWTFGNGGTSGAADPLHPFGSPGTYDVTLIATNAFGCQDTASFEDYVEVYPLPLASFSLTPTQTDVYQPVVSFYDESIGAVNWIWDFDDGFTESGVQFPQHLYQQAGFFTPELTVVSIHGCTASTQRSLNIDDRFNMYVPNTFTPDDDGVNDTFSPILTGIGLIEEYNFAIFDRWGHKVYETDDPAGVWIGDFKGNATHYTQDDVYVWQVKLRLRGEDESRFETGHVTLLR